jgi:dipeptidyl-peptidase-4
MQAPLVLVWCLLAAVNGCAPRSSSVHTSSTHQWLRYDDIPGAQAVKQAQKRNRGLVQRPKLSEVIFEPDGTSVRVKNESQWRTFDLGDGRLLAVEPLEPATEEATQTPDTSDTAGQTGQPDTASNKDTDKAADKEADKDTDNEADKDTDKEADKDTHPTRTRVPRGGQATEVTSPDKKWTAVHRDFNVLLRDADGHEWSVTNRGTPQHAFGTASWVYGEELDQNTAMWFSPDSTLLAFYAFDVSDVPNYQLLSGLSELRPAIQAAAYPKPGDPNPVATLWIYEIKLRRMTQVDVGDNDDQYVYGVSFTPDSRYLLYHRMNRLQNELELVRVDPRTGDATVLFSESQPTWVHYSPRMRWLKDGRRVLIATERSGFRTWELWDVDSGRLAVLGPGTFQAGAVVRIDESDAAPGGGTLYFSGYSDTHPLNLQLHAVHLDGSGFRRLTGEPLNHSNFRLSPDGQHVIADASTATVPPRIVLYGPDAQALATIDEADTTALQASNARPSELFSFEAADGQTCYGRIHYPSKFDPSDTWPVLVQVYGGPLSHAVRNTFQLSSSRTEFGFVIVQIDNRGTEGRGKAFEGAIWLQLGQVDLDDQARGIQVLADRHAWLDTDRVGITGHSYGGYMSVLALLRYPETFSVAVASAPVTDWRQYDTIYTERYMQTPDSNGDNYDAGSCVKLAEQLKGNLLLLHGMMDDNVHPSNSWQLAEALQAADIPFQMQFYPISAHGIHQPASKSAKWSFLVEHLVPAR